MVAWWHVAWWYGGMVAWWHGGMVPGCHCMPGAGVVESVGEGVTSLVVGEPVVPCGLPHCGECALCLHPRCGVGWSRVEDSTVTTTLPQRARVRHLL